MTLGNHNENGGEGSEAELSAAVEEALADVAADVANAVAEEIDQVAILTADLQRLSAEYANYRKRIDRDRLVERELSIAGVMNELLPVLDNLERAEQHGELTGGFKAVADQLLAVTTKFGLEKFGEEGSTFDPQIHEALLHETSSEVTETSVTKVLQPGYKIKERVIRPARVAVADPEN